MATAILLAGCGSGEPNLMNIRSNTSGPDEFAILPPKPLELPTDLASLPAPTPGGTSRTDATPHEDAIAALGGTAPVAQGAVPGGDGGLVAYASRKGVQSGIRQTLAAEDYEFRKKNDGRLLERLFNVNVYFRAYEKQALDQQRELDRWRRQGVGNPSAPPPQDGE